MVLQWLCHVFRRWSALKALVPDIAKHPLGAEPVPLTVFAIASLKEVIIAGKQSLNQL